MTNNGNQIRMSANAVPFEPPNALQVEVMAEVYELVKQSRAAYANLLDEFHTTEQEKGKTKHRGDVAKCQHVQCKYHREKLEDIDNNVGQLEAAIGEIELPMSL